MIAWRALHKFPLWHLSRCCAYRIIPSQVEPHKAHLSTLQSKRMIRSQGLEQKPELFTASHELIHQKQQIIFMEMKIKWIWISWLAERCALLWSNNRFQKLCFRIKSPKVRWFIYLLELRLWQPPINKHRTHSRTITRLIRQITKQKKSLVAIIYGFEIESFLGINDTVFFPQ